MSRVCLSLRQSTALGQSSILPRPSLPQSRYKVYSGQRTVYVQHFQSWAPGRHLMHSSIKTRFGIIAPVVRLLQDAGTPSLRVAQLPPLSSLQNCPGPRGCPGLTAYTAPHPQQPHPRSSRVQWSHQMSNDMSMQLWRALLQRASCTGPLWARKPPIPLVTGTGKIHTPLLQHTPHSLKHDCGPTVIRTGQ
jgi:hypothetical protein